MLGRRAERNNRQPQRLQTRKAALPVLAVFLFAAALIAWPHAAVHAVDVGLDFATATGLATTDVRTLVGNVIRAFLGLLGLLAVVLMLYAGYLWMTAGGNEEKITTAKKIMTNAVIGLVVIVSAYAIAAFILRALGVGGLGGFGGGNGAGGSTFNALFSGSRGQDALGNGVVDYHYPETGQADVPRNAKISVTFKKPFKLSTVLANYDDGGTYAVADDRLCAGAPPCPNDPLVSSVANPTFRLNVANVKLIPNEGLASGGSGSVDAQFDNRHPDSAAVVNPAPSARVTPVAEPLAPGQYQTLVFTPAAPIGSPSTNVNYRVALRGGENGVQVWALPDGGGEPQAEPAFASAYADGGYYWPFATGTVIDTTPPKVVAVAPSLTTTPGSPASSILDRNQLLQFYFDEAVDPATASGVIGAGGGFANVEVTARCLPGTFPSSCSFNGGNAGTVDGTLMLGNRYRTAEFVPSAPCDGVSQNSCGETVRCLPKNVRLTVRVLAATVGTEPPAAAAANGVTDMVGNSFDGNGDGAAQGPQSPVQPSGRSLDYYRNDPPAAAGLAATSDTARWEYVVGDDVDLVAPVITALDPPSPPPEGAAHPVGPSRVPTDLIPSITWSKRLSIGSLRAGGFDELAGTYADPESTLVLRSRECAKTSSTACPVPPSQCPCQNIDPPGFFIDAGVPFEDPAGSGNMVTRVRFIHPARPFYTANDLGYTASDIENYPDNIPAYAPIARAQIKDDKQNCFWPSQYKPSPTAPECALGAGQHSCCDRTGSTDDTFLGTCAP